MSTSVSPSRWDLLRVTFGITTEDVLEEKVSHYFDLGYFLGWVKCDTDS